MATRCSVLAWPVPWTEEPGGPQSTGCKESDTTDCSHMQSTKAGVQGLAHVCLFESSQLEGVYVRGLQYYISFVSLLPNNHGESII